VALTTLTGCLNDTNFGSQGTTKEYTLDIDRIESSPVEYALYEPDNSSLFGGPAQTALENILPEGRHTTYGFEPLPTDAYVEYEGSYYQTKYVVTGRQQIERQIVRVETVPQEQVPDDSILVETLDRPSARINKNTALIYCEWWRIRHCRVASRRRVCVTVAERT
jgi:hypothetical protein